MSIEADILEKIDAAFGLLKRPEHFTNFLHCEECLEHDKTLLSRPRDELTLEQLGMAGWDAVTFCMPEAKAYLFPRLARLALAEPDGKYGWYGPQLLNHLYAAYDYNDLWQYSNAEQRLAIAGLLDFIINTRSALIDSYAYADEFLRCHELWSNAQPIIPPDLSRQVGPVRQIQTLDAMAAAAVVHCARHAVAASRVGRVQLLESENAPS